MAAARRRERWEIQWRALDHNPPALAEARHKRGWSQRRLAAEVGITRPYVSELEKGSRNANPALLLRLALALRCSVSSLEHVKTPPKLATPKGMVPSDRQAACRAQPPRGNQRP